MGFVLDLTQIEMSPQEVTSLIDHGLISSWIDRGLTKFGTSLLQHII